MSVLALVVQGLLIGVAVALPIGPMALLCIQQTLRSGSLAGLASGLGVASADALYAGLAIAGLAVMQDALAHHQRGFALIGGVILLGLGARLLGRDLPAQAAPLHAGGLAAAYGATLALTLTSPLTIVSFVAIFAALGIQPGDGTLIEGAILVVSVFLGSVAWWLLLVELVDSWRRWIGPTTLRWLNRAAGAAIAGLGAFALVSAF